MALSESNEQADSPENPSGSRSPRVQTSHIGASSSARLMPGGDAEVINISNTGLRIEGRNRLVVGATVSIRIRGSAIKRFDGKIVRSHVSTIHRDGSLSYESAIEFDRPYPVTEPLSDEERASAADKGTDAQPGSEEDVYVLDADNDW